MSETAEKPATCRRGHRALDNHGDIDGGEAKDHESNQTSLGRSEKQRRLRNRNSESQNTRDNHNIDGGEASDHRPPSVTRSRTTDSERGHLPGKQGLTADTSNTKDRMKADANDKDAGYQSTQLKRRTPDEQPLETLKPSDARLGMLILFNDREPATSRQLQQDIRAAHDRGRRLAEGYLEVEYNNKKEVIASTPLCVKQRPAVIVEWTQNVMWFAGSTHLATKDFDTKATSRGRNILGFKTTEMRSHSSPGTAGFRYAPVT